MSLIQRNNSKFYFEGDAFMSEWAKKVREKKVKVGVLGLGYVGLPLVREFTSEGFKVLGFDIDGKKVNVLNSGRSIIKHIPHSQVRKMVKLGLFSATTNMARLKNVDALLVCVPTPLTKNREPDMQFITGSHKFACSSWDISFSDWMKYFGKILWYFENIPLTNFYRREVRLLSAYITSFEEKTNSLERIKDSAKNFAEQGKLFCEIAEKIVDLVLKKTKENEYYINEINNLKWLLRIK